MLKLLQQAISRFSWTEFRESLIDACIFLTFVLFISELIFYLALDFYIF